MHNTYFMDKKLSKNKSKSASILVVGSVALDTIKTPFGNCEEVLGGSATYFSTSASFFSPVNLVAVVGEDFPSQHMEFLKNRGIDLKGLEFAGGKTFRWEGEYSWDFNNAKTIATHLNVFLDFDPKIPKEYKYSKYLFLANIDPQLQDRVLHQVGKPKLVACDTMNHWIESKRKYLLGFLNRIDVFLLNDLEARQLTGENNLLKAAKQIFKFGPKIVIIKKGEHGALLFSGDFTFCVPAFLLEKVCDPTGAGDTFAGGFMGFLSTCKKINAANLKKAVVFGSVMATFAVEDFSLRRLAAVNIRDINKRLNEFKKFVSF